MKEGRSLQEIQLYSYGKLLLGFQVHILDLNNLLQTLRALLGISSQTSQR